MSIGKTALVLTTSSAKLNSGLDAASKKIHGFANGASKSVNSAFSGFGSMAMKLAPAIAGVLTLTKAMGDIGNLATVGDISDSMGIDKEFFSGLAGIAKESGASIEDVRKGLGNLQKVTDFKNESVTAAFANIGMGVKDFLALDVESKFRAVQTAMDALPPGADKAQFAIAMMGEEGAKLAPTMAKGTAEMERLSAQFAVSAEGLQKIQDADTAWKTVLGSMTKLWNEVLVAIAPVITMVSEGLVVALDSVWPVVQGVGVAFSEAFSIAGEAISLIVTPISDAINWVMEIADQLIGFSEISMSVEEMVSGAFRFIGKGFAYVYDTAKLLAGGISYVAGAFVKGIGYIIEGIKNLISMAKYIPGVSGEWIDSISGSVEVAENKMKGIGDNMQDWGKGTWDTFGDSADKVDKWFDKREERKAKLDSLVKNEIPEADKSAGKKMNFLAPATAAAKEAAKDIGYTAVAANIKGSAAAYSLEAKLRTNSLLGSNVNDSAKQVAELKKTNRGIDRLITAIERKEPNFAVV